VSWLLSPFGRVLLAVGLLGSSFGWGYLRGDGHGRDAIQRLWDAERLARTQEQARSLEAARAREHLLQTEIDKIRQEKNREIVNLNRRNAALADSLRSRPERPASVPAPTPPAPSVGPNAQSCTGRELYRPDAEFLVREAARADQIRINLAACEAAYNSLKKD
jgi:hypothetical protein